MKLRIKGDSLRLRLSQTDVRTLAESGAVADEMQVAPGAALGYALQAADTDTLGATLDGCTLTVLIPRAWAGSWMESDTVGFDGTVPAGEGRTLAILVEKDFACLDEDRDEADAFPNPSAEAC